MMLVDVWSGDPAPDDGRLTIGFGFVHDIFFVDEFVQNELVKEKG